MKERLHKFLAQAGLGSRRKCEQFILEGRVLVDGKPVTKLGTKVDPEKQDVRFEDRRLRPQLKVYYLVHKPRHVECTQGRPQGMRRGYKPRRRLIDLLPPMRERVFTVGRLDHDSEGLILVTNDGELCNRLTHPRYRIPRTYHVVLEGALDAAAVERVQKGIWLSEGRTGKSKVLIKKRTRQMTVLEITIFEGMNREVRRIFANVGYPVAHLKRIRFGPLHLGTLGLSHWRPLTTDEVRRLREFVEGDSSPTSDTEGWAPERQPPRPSTTPPPGDPAARSGPEEEGERASHDDEE